MAFCTWKHRELTEYYRWSCAVLITTTAKRHIQIKPPKVPQPQRETFDRMDQTQTAAVIKKNNNSESVKLGRTNIFSLSHDEDNVSQPAPDGDPLLTVGTGGADTACWFLWRNELETVKSQIPPINWASSSGRAPLQPNGPLVQHYKNITQQIHTARWACAASLYVHVDMFLFPPCTHTAICPSEAQPCFPDRAANGVHPHSPHRKLTPSLVTSEKPRHTQFVTPWSEWLRSMEGDKMLTDSWQCGSKKY